MKVMSCIILSVLVACAAQVQADTEAVTESSDSPNNYIGIKGGPMVISRDIPFDNDGVMLGILFGYDVPGNNIAIEGELNTTIADASSTNPSYGDLSATTLAGYAVFRSSGRFYVKGKLGVLYEYLSSSVSGTTTIDVDGAGMAISFGLGAGVEVNDKMSIEAEYTSLEADIGYGSIGLNWTL